MNRRKRRGLVFYVMVALISIGGAAMAHVWVRMQLVQVGYELAREKKQGDELEQANQRLRTEVDGLKSPGRLEGIAQGTLKMTPADPSLIRLVRRVASAPTSEESISRWAKR